MAKVQEKDAPKRARQERKRDREFAPTTANADRLPRKPKERPPLPFRFPGVNGEDCLQRDGGNSLSERLVSQRTPRSPAG